MLERIYDFEKNIIRIGGRSESSIMQKLTISSVKKNGTFPFITRSPEEYKAMDIMHTSLASLKAYLSQRQVLKHMQDTKSGASFANSVLARLRVILQSCAGENVANVIDELVNGTSYQVKRQSWLECCKTANTVFGSNSPLDDWMLKDDEEVAFKQNWLNFPIDEQLLLCASYAPAELVGTTIVDAWKQKEPQQNKKISKNQVDADGFILVGSPNAVVTDDITYGDFHDNINNNLRDSSLNNPDPDVLFENLCRQLDGEYENDDEADWDKLATDGSYHYGVSLRRSNRPEDLVNVILQHDSVLNVPSELVTRLKQASLTSIWSWSRKDREEIALIWAKLLDIDAATHVNKLTQDYRTAAAICSIYNDKVDASVLRSAAAIGMTTNGAAKYNSMIRALGPEVIIVEEAAEVSEASVIASFTSNTKHLVLIGDHLQLRPQVVEHKLAVYNGLEISLFERLIKLGLPYVVLTTQRRMHPDISSLICPAVYKQLHDAPNTKEYPLVHGIRHRLFFINHTEPEDGEEFGWGDDGARNTMTKKAIQPIDLVGAERSKTNTFEAEFIVRLAKYLVRTRYF